MTRPYQSKQLYCFLEIYYLDLFIIIYNILFRRIKSTVNINDCTVNNKYAKFEGFYYRNVCVKTNGFGNDNN